MQANTEPISSKETVYTGHRISPRRCLPTRWLSVYLLSVCRCFLIVRQSIVVWATTKPPSGT